MLAGEFLNSNCAGATSRHTQYKVNAKHARVQKQQRNFDLVDEEAPLVIEVLPPSRKIIWNGCSETDWLQPTGTRGYATRH